MTIVSGRSVRTWPRRHVLRSGWSEYEEGTPWPTSRDLGSSSVTSAVRPTYVSILGLGRSLRGALRGALDARGRQGVLLRRALGRTLTDCLLRGRCGTRRAGTRTLSGRRIADPARATPHSDRVHDRPARGLRAHARSVGRGAHAEATTGAIGASVALEVTGRRLGLGGGLLDEELSGRRIERVRELPHGVQREVAPAVLDGADVRAVELGDVSEPFLAQPGRVPDASQSCPECASLRGLLVRIWHVGDGRCGSSIGRRTMSRRTMNHVRSLARRIDAQG